MDLKQWRTPAVILVLLAAGYLLTQLGESRHTTSVDAVFDLKKDDVGRIVMVVDNDRAELVRQDSLWVLAGYEDREVRQWRLTSFFTNVLTVSRESVISDLPEKWSTYGVDSTAGRQVEVYDLGGDLAGRMVVGRSASNYQTNYIRLADESEVYLTDKSIYHFLSADTGYWLEPPPPEPEEEGGEAEELPVKVLGEPGSGSDTE